MLRSSLLPGALLAIVLATAATAASNVVEYTYDAVGNITQIKRQVTASFAITGFTPASGVVGTAVTIYGAGFSTTPANNVVRFNGTDATVVSSEAGSISTTVPAGATNGRISVTVSGVTAISAQDFFVVTPGAPTITSFTPTSGVATNVVSVTGTGFEVGTGATVVKLNGSVAGATMASATAFSFAVPANTSSGRITATTSAGTATSSSDFLVPPPGIALADVGVTVRLATGGNPSNVALNSANKHALILFDGVAATYYTMQFGQMAVSQSAASASYTVVKPDNTVLTSGYIGSTGSYRPTIHLPKLPASGTYSVVVSPGNATLNANVRVSADPSLAIDGGAVATALDTPSQSARFVIDAAASQQIGLGLIGVSSVPTQSTTTMKAYRPDGSALPAMYACYGSTTDNPEGICANQLSAGAAGAYTVVAEAASGFTTNFSIQASAEVSGGALTPDVAADLSLTRVGQVVRYTFAGEAATAYGVDVSGFNSLPRAHTFYAEPLKPDGTALPYCSGKPPVPVYCELAPLATEGTYSVKVSALAYGAYGTAKVTLKKGPALLTSDPPLAFTAASISETMRFRFTGTAGQNLSVAISELAYIGSSSNAATLTVHRPDGVALYPGANCTPTFYGGDCALAYTGLPTTGTYSVVLKPPGGVRMTGKVNINADLTGTLVSGTIATISAPRPGQSARYTFSGTAGDSALLKLFGVSTTPTGNSIHLSLVRPDGSKTSIGYAYASGTPAVSNIGSLATTGTYTALIETPYGVPWTGKLMLEPGPLLTIDGATANVVGSTAGEPLRYRFAASAGQKVVVAMASLAYAAANTASSDLKVFRPDGTTIVGSTLCYPTLAGCEVEIASAPSTGTYSIVVTPPVSSAIAAGVLALSVAPVTGTLVIGDPAQTIAITRPGQTASYTFSGTAAQLLRLNWSGTTVSGSATVTVKVLKPDGTQLNTSSFANNSSSGLNIDALPTTGTYSVVFDPGSAASMSASVSLVTR